MNPLQCERCGRDLESDDAISIIEGVCCACRRTAAQQQLRTGARIVPPAPPTAATPRPRLVPRQVDLPSPVIQAPRPPVTPAAPTVRPKPAAQALAEESLYGHAPRSRRRRRDLAIGVTLGLIVVGAMTGYMVTQRLEPIQLALPGQKAEAMPVRLIVKPAWATVTLDDAPISAPSEEGILTITLPPDQGEMHWLAVDAEGYHPVRRPITRQAGVSDMTIELVQKPIDLVVHSEPPEAEVWIDNQYKGNTPLTLTMLPWEQSTLSLKREGYEPVSKKITPPERGRFLKLDIEMEPAGVLVRVETDPPGALVTVDGQVRGPTPVDVAMPPEYRGKDVEITATLPGYEKATLRTSLPDEIGAAPVVARMELARPRSELVIRTDPPGAEVFVEGASIGASPATARFGPEQIGRRVTVEGRIAGTHGGRLEVLAPPAGEKSEVTVPLETVGQTAVFVVLSPTGTGPDHVLLTDRVIEQIHGLDVRQRFCLVSCTVDGIEAWPGRGEAAEATSDNKIRAYDLVRSIRPSARGPAAKALSEALTLQPGVVWLFTGAKLREAELSSLGAAAGPVVNVCQVGPRAAEPWLERWVAARSGVLAVIEGGPRRVIAREDEGVE